MLTFRQKTERLTLRFRAKLMLARGRQHKESLLEHRRGLTPMETDIDSWSVSSSGSWAEPRQTATPAATPPAASSSSASAAWPATPTPPTPHTPHAPHSPHTPAGASPLLMPAPLVAPAPHTHSTHRKTIKTPTTNRALKEARRRDFFRHGIMRHAELRMHNRGLWLPPVDAKANGRWNLGNLLHITDKYMADLDEDQNQSVPQPKLTSAVLPDRRNSVHIRSLHIKDSENLFDRSLFNAAQKLVHEQFAKKSVKADLEGVLDDDFTLDVVIDPITGHVVGAVEYVFMKRYLWIDAIAVREDVRGLGVGCVMMERLRNIATIRSKEILCFGLHDVCGWYQRQGFTVSSEFPQLPWHIGKFLVWKPSTHT